MDMALAIYDLGTKKNVSASQLGTQVLKINGVPRSTQIMRTDELSLVRSAEPF